MKNTSKIFLFLLFLVVTTNPLFANKKIAKKMIGTWNISANIDAETEYKNWSGTIVVSKHGDGLKAKLDWTSSGGEWHVIQDMSISKDGQFIVLQSTSLNILKQPENAPEYHPDFFTIDLGERTDKTIPATAGDRNGTPMSFTISKS